MTAAREEAERRFGTSTLVVASTHRQGFQEGAEWQREQDEAEIARLRAVLQEIADTPPSDDRDTCPWTARQALA